MIKVLCDRCNVEIQGREKIWNQRWNYKYKENFTDRFQTECDGYEEYDKLEPCFCEKCKNEIEEFALKVPKSTTKKKKEVDHERILQLHNEGMSNKEIAEEMGITAQKVYHSLADKSKVGSARREEPDPETVIELYRAGWKVHDIADETRGNEEEIKKIILRAAAEEAG